MRMEMTLCLIFDSTLEAFRLSGIVTLRSLPAVRQLEISISSFQQNYTGSPTSNERRSVLRDARKRFSRLYFLQIEVFASDSHGDLARSSLQQVSGPSQLQGVHMEAADCYIHLSMFIRSVLCLIS